VRDGETGLLVPPGDADALAAALLKLLGDRELAENLGRRGHEFALRHLDERAYADRLLGLYRRLLEEDAGRAANDRVRRWAQAS
jgi:glycosyltransferase involved in cell wall biosynthesis